MNNHSMSSRLKILERENEDLIQDKRLNKFIESLPIHERQKFKSTTGVIVFEGQPEDFKTIMKPFGDIGRTVIVDDINEELIEKYNLEQNSQKEL